MGIDMILNAVGIAVVVLLVLGLLGANIRIVPQSRAFVIERLGAFQGVWGLSLIHI